MVAVMEAADPHPSKPAVPLVVAVSTALRAREGILLFTRAAFERAGDIQASIFDKTVFDGHSARQHFFIACRISEFQ